MFFVPFDNHMTQLKELVPEKVHFRAKRGYDTVLLWKIVEICARI